MDLFCIISYSVVSRDKKNSFIAGFLAVESVNRVANWQFDFSKENEKFEKKSQKIEFEMTVVIKSNEEVEIFY